MQVPFADFVLGPLAGLVISTSGGNSREKAELRELVVQAGGTYSPQFDKTCTHLLIKRCDAERAVSEKERCVREQSPAVR